MKYLNIVLILFLAFGLTAQITSGSLTMEMTDITTSMPGGEQMAEMMKGSEMSMHFTPDKQVTITNMKMMGMDMKTLNYIDGAVSTTYMDMMGQKMKMTMDISDLSKLGLEKEDIPSMYEVTYDKSDTKEILGYTCYKADVKIDMSSLGADMPAGMKDMSMSAYVTEDIKMSNFSMKEFQGLQFKGTPLMMIMDVGMMKMTYEATSFSKDVDPSIFEHPEGDYKEMDPAMLEGFGINKH